MLAMLYSGYIIWVALESFMLFLELNTLLTPFFFEDSRARFLGGAGAGLGSGTASLAFGVSSFTVSACSLAYTVSTLPAAYPLACSANMLSLNLNSFVGN